METPKLSLNLSLLIMEWFTDREWMYKMTDSDGYVDFNYIRNVNLFLDFVYSNEAVVDKYTRRGKMVRDIKCPCRRCRNARYSNRKTVQKHLYMKGFMSDYLTWWAHGETETYTNGVEKSSTTTKVYVNGRRGEDTSVHTPIDVDVCSQAVGGKKKRKLCGSNDVTNQFVVMTGSSKTPSTSVSYPSERHDEVCLFSFSHKSDLIYEPFILRIVVDNKS